MSHSGRSVVFTGCSLRTLHLDYIYHLHFKHKENALRFLGPSFAITCERVKSLKDVLCLHFVIGTVLCAASV